MQKFIIYTDGSCRGNGKENNTGGYAFVILNENDKVLVKRSCQELNTTNNRMEMKAIIEALGEVMHFINGQNFLIEIYSDSAYVHNCKTQKWYKSWQNNNWKNSKKEPVKNKELWELLIFFFEDARFIFNKVKGHAGNKYNEIVDKLAVAASDGKEVYEKENINEDSSC